MDVAELLTDGLCRVRESVHDAIEGLSSDQLMFRPDDEANSVAWLVWHLSRVQDDHVADAFDVPQVWTAHGWADRFALPFATSATGYGHRPEDVAAVRVPDGALLLGYHDAVHDQTVRLLTDVVADDLERVVDRSWDPPVTLGVRLVSVISDDLQHAGQAAFVAGLARRYDDVPPRTRR